MMVIPIRNYALQKYPRVFDVTIDDNGEIVKYEMQNIKGSVYIDNAEVQRQIQKAMNQK